MNDVFKYLHHKFNKNGANWNPFIAYYYLTYDCNFKCSYCCDGYGTPYYQHSAQGKLSAEKAVEVMKIIHKNVNYAVITGGEPLTLPEFEYFIDRVGKLKFKRLALTTNGFYLDKYAENILNSIDNLIVSVDTLNKTKADKTFGIGVGTLDKVLENIDFALDINKTKKKLITISSVTTPENIEDQYELIDYAYSRGIQYTTSPQLVGVKPNAGLIENPEYIKLFDYMIRERKRYNIFGSRAYLTAMRDLKDFQCHPFTMMGISPVGDIFYPCPEIGNKAANIFEIDDINKAKQIGFSKFGAPPKCGNQCHSCCALIFSLLLKTGGSFLNF